MFKTKLRLLSVSALVGAGLIATGPADAYNLRLGNVDVNIDTNISAGVSVRVADRENKLLPEANGGNVDDRPLVVTAATGAAWGASLYVDGGAAIQLQDAAVVAATLAGVQLAAGGAPFGTVNNIGPLCNDNGSECSWLAKQSLTSEVLNPNYADNYDTGMNADDGRLNFDNGDLQGGVVKAVFDVSADLSNNLRAFARINSFYDAVLDSDSNFERTGITGDDADDMVLNVELLDAYLDYTGIVADRPYQVRVGKQVINWGESTFVLGGNSVFSPIDVSAIVRPGSEIKEALLPVEAIYGSIALTENVSVEAYYGGWEKFKLPVAGTPFAGSDISNVGSEGNQNIAFISGSPGGGNNRVNCAARAGDIANGYTASSPASNQTIEVADIAIAAFADAGFGCETTPAMDFRYSLGTNGDLTPEAERIEGPDVYRFQVTENDGGDGDNMGLAVRWYAENLNSTEFGFYYQKYKSRLPYVSYWTDTPGLGFETMGRTTDLASRLLGVGGCGKANLAIQAASSGAFGQLDVSAGTNTDYASLDVNDPYGIFETTLDDFHNNGSGLPTGTKPNLQQAMEMVCHNTREMAAGDAGGYAVTLTGEMRPVVTQNMGLFLDYPEDIEVVGVSFATTLAGWGVQGEIAYRPEMPLQIDTDSLAIGALVNNCGLANYGNGGAGVLAAFSIYPDSADLPGANNAAGTPMWDSINAYVSYDSLTTRAGLTGCDNTDYEVIRGYMEREVTNFDLGTTATYTRSNPIVSALGADLMVFLTEIAGTFAPEIEHRTYKQEDPTADGRVTTTISDSLGDDTPLRGASHCTSGTDLPLGSLFNLDPRDGDQCRPTDIAIGGVLFLSLQYNNVFGTAASLSPAIIVQHGIEGRSPRPAGSFTEDQGSASFRLNASYQDMSIGLSYTDYYGDVLYNSNIDRDFVALDFKMGF
jgi:hypothetical protein